jgi:hypothetical protein
MMGLILVALGGVLLAGLALLLGFSLGGRSGPLAREWRVRMESAMAIREMQDITRQAFNAIAEEAEKRWRGRQ